MALLGEQGVELELGLSLDVVDRFRGGLEGQQLEESRPGRPGGELLRPGVEIGP
jgi:hypothetical protein